MPQTFLAIAAIMCLALLALGQQRHDHDLTRHTVAMEVEQAATDVARAWMTRVERMAFDETDVGREGIRTQPSPAPLGPDDGETGPATFDDVDDWHAHTAAESIEMGMGALRFQAAVSVRYMQNLAPSEPAPAATLTKEIRISVVELQDGPSGRRPAQTMLRRVVTPASIGAQTPAPE